MDRTSHRIAVAHFSRKYLWPTETFVYNQIRSLQLGQDYEVQVYCNTLEEVFDSTGWEVTVIGKLIDTTLGRWYNRVLYKYLRTLSRRAGKRIIDDLEKKDIRLLHFHYLTEATYFRDLLLNYDAPKVVSAYGWDVAEFPGRYFGTGRRLLTGVFENVDLVLAMSEDMKSDLKTLGCPSGKIHVHYHGIDISRFRSIVRNGRGKKDLVFLTVASLNEKKGHKYSLDALSMLRGSLAFKYRVVGDGPLLSELEKYAKSLDIGDLVEFVGHKNHHSDSLLEEYRNADIFIHPSVTARSGDKEGIPGTVVEAMASGLPIVSTYHAGIPDVLKNGFSGILVREREATALASAIKELAESAELRHRLGRNAREAAEGLDCSEKTRNLEDIYSILIDSHGKKVHHQS